MEVIKFRNKNKQIEMSLFYEWLFAIENPFKTALFQFYNINDKIILQMYIQNELDWWRDDNGLIKTTVKIKVTELASKETMEFLLENIVDVSD